jgi:hypothetical protein
VIADKRATRDSYYGAALLAGSAIYLCANLFATPTTPFLLGGDQALFWTNALRLLHGELIYRDFLEFTPPGADLIYLGMFRLLGSRIWVANLVVLVLGVTLCWLCFRVARSIMSPVQAALAAALLVVLDYGRMLNGTHHWFSMLAVMGALAILLSASTPWRIAAAGMLLGVASFFTQTRGPFAALGVAAFVMWDRRQTQQPWQTCLKHASWIIVPLVMTWVALSSYFIAKLGFWQLWYFQVTYVLRYVTTGPSDLSFSSPEVLAWLAKPEGLLFLLIFFTVPGIYALTVWRCSRRVPRSDSSDSARRESQRIMLLTFVGATLFVEVAESPNWIRLYCVVIPAIILGVWLLTHTLTTTLRGYATTLMWAGLICVAAQQTWSRHRHQALFADLPAGRVATARLTGEKLAWLARHTTPGQLFFEARWVDLYMPLALRNPTFTDMLEGGHNSRPEFVDLSIRQLEARQVRYIIWAHRLESSAYPFARFRQFLAERYQRVFTFPDQDEVWQLK